MPCKRIKIGAKGYISASQVANMYGCGYGTMLDLYNRFIGKIDEDNKPSEEAQKSMDFGAFFEDTVAKYAAKVLSLGELIKCGTTAYYLAERPYLICHPDRLVKNPKDGKRIALEIKCVSPYAEGFGEEFTSEVPDKFFFQCETYFACGVPCDVVYLVVLKGNRVYFYVIAPDAEIIADIQKRTDKCYQEFIKGIIPSSENYDEQLTVTREKVDWASDAVGANDAMLAVIDKLKENKELREKLDAEDGELKRCLLEYMDKSPTLVTTENGKMKKLATLAERERKTFDSKTFIADHPDMDFENYWKRTNYMDFRVVLK